MRPGRPSSVGERRLPAAALAAASLLLLSAGACGPPASQEIEGPAADEVRAALDSGDARFEHPRWDSLLAEGTREGLVDYRHFQENRGRLDAYLERLAGADLSRLAPAHLEALLINAYNAYTVEAILENPGVSSIREIDGVWTETERQVGGHGLTLDEIEHRILRPFFRDPRLHFVLNCASLSCAPLPPGAFHGDSLEAHLEARTRAFLTDTANVRAEDGVLRLSRYFDWYGSDFTSEGWSPRAETIPAFVAAYARPDVARLVEEADGSPPVEFLEYDWSLNAAVPPDPEPEVEAEAEDEGTAPSGAGWVEDLRGWVDGFGPAAPLVYGTIYAVGVAFMVPASPLTVGAGVAFGLLWGTVLTSIASTLGAGLAFLLARGLLRGRLVGQAAGPAEAGASFGRRLLPAGSVEGWLEENREKFEALDRAVAREGWKVVALTRLSPVFPYNVLNYAYGLTRVRFGPYLLASWVAMLPGTLLYVYLGVAGTRVAASATGAASWGQTALQVAGLLATVGVVYLVTRTARRLLRETADVEGSPAA